MSDISQSNDAAAPLSRRILVIEDNFDSAEVLQTFLEINGHEIVVCYDGATGLECARQTIPDVIICDINLSGEMDGYDIAGEIRRDARTESIFLIALSGYGRREDKEKSISAGFDSHLVKPTNFDELLNLINDFSRD